MIGIGVVANASPSIKIVLGSVPWPEMEIFLPSSLSVKPPPPVLSSAAPRVVGTAMTNFGLERALGELNIPFDRAAVGDRHVLEMLRNRGWSVGGEASGHIICLDLTTTGDAIVAALQALTPMVEQQRPLHELVQGMAKLPQVMLNVPVVRRVPFEQLSTFQAAVEKVEAELADCGRVLIRYSGTELKARVMVEGEEESRVREMAGDLADELRRALAVGGG